MQLAQIEQMQQAAQAQQQGGQPGPDGQPMPAQPAPQAPAPDQDKITDLKSLAEACSWEEIEAILRSDQRRSYTVDVETTETAAVDEETDKAQATEFMTAMTAWLQIAIPGVQANPTQAPLFKELTMMYVSKFKPGRALEEAFDDAFDQIKSAPPQPNPEEEKVKAEMALKEKDLQMRMAEKQADIQANEKKSQQDMAFKTQEHQLKIQGQQADLASKAKDLEFKERELQMKVEENAFTRQLAAQTAIQDREGKMEERQFQREDREYDRSFRERELGMKSEDAQFKRYDMEERRKSDIQDKTERRGMEAEFMAGKVGKSTSDLNEKVVSAEAQRQGKERDGLRQEVTSVAEKMLETQAMIAEAVQSLRRDVDQTQEIMLAALKRMGAPRRIVKDPKTGKAVGMEIIEEAAA
jgi:hypothetical protein